MTDPLRAAVCWAFLTVSCAALAWHALRTERPVQAALAFAGAALSALVAVLCVLCGAKGAGR